MTGRPGSDLTIVINFYNMQREAPRTLSSLLPDYQRGVSDLRYEIVAVDNGSSKPLDPKMVESIVGTVGKYTLFETDSASPAAAINSAVRESSSEWILCLIDGARMASPGIVGLAMLCARGLARPFVYTLSMHLGHRLQNEAIKYGYNQATEDALLSTVDWRSDGYSLFEISTVALSSGEGFFSKLKETNCFLMRRDDYLAIGGLSEEFQSPGGGLVNLDFFNRIHGDSAFEPVMLLGEATFHQIHGGVASNAPLNRHPWHAFAEEYRQIRGHEFHHIWRPPIYVGRILEARRDLVSKSFVDPPAPRLSRLGSRLSRLVGVSRSGRLRKP